MKIDKMQNPVLFYQDLASRQIKKPYAEYLEYIACGEGYKSWDDFVAAVEAGKYRG